MKNKIFIIAFSLLLSVSAFSNPIEVRKKDLKVIEKIYYLKDSEIPFTGKVSEGRDRLYYLNGRQDGKWISFYKNGNIKSIVNWKDGKLNGKYVIYEENLLKLSTKMVKKMVTIIYIILMELIVQKVHIQWENLLENGNIMIKMVN